MNSKQCFILIVGVIGILIVVLYPLWFYPAHPLMMPKESAGNSLITEPPKPLPVVRTENGRTTIYTGSRIAPHIDRIDLFKRVGMIFIVTLIGLLALQAMKKSKGM